MGHRIRKAMKQDAGLLSGIVEMDETYVGGKPRKEAKKKDDDDDKGNPRGRGTKKECVVGMIERNGKVKASNVNKGSLKAKDLKELVRANIDTANKKNPKKLILLTQISTSDEKRKIASDSTYFFWATSESF